MLYNTKSTQETIQLGRDLSKYLVSGDVILLDGDLGAGKTHFVKGLAEGLGITADVNSPTFTILNNYPIVLKGPPGVSQLNHYDVYRVHDEYEILDLGFEESIYGADISVIEWSRLIPGILPDDCLKIEILTGTELDEREITMTWCGTHSERSLPYVNSSR